VTSDAMMLAPTCSNSANTRFDDANEVDSANKFCNPYHKRLREKRTPCFCKKRPKVTVQKMIHEMILQIVLHAHGPLESERFSHANNDQEFHATLCTRRPTDALLPKLKRKLNE
jgi:hypothetical protein